MVLHLSVSLGTDFLSFSVLLVLLPIAYIPSAIRIPQGSLAISFLKFPLTFIHGAIFVPFNSVAILLAVLKIANIIGTFSFVYEETFHEASFVEKAVEGQILFVLSAHSMKSVVLEISEIFFIFLFKSTKALPLLRSFEPVCQIWQLKI